MMRRVVIRILIGLTILCIYPAFTFGQNGTSLFVIYGTVYEFDGVTPVNDDYLITVTNVSTGRTNSLTVGEHDGLGRYSVVWLHELGDFVVELDHTIKVTAEKMDENAFGDSRDISMEDIAANRIRIDINRGQIGLEAKSWGAIKSLYR